MYVCCVVVVVVVVVVIIVIVVVVFVFVLVVVVVLSDEGVRGHTNKMSTGRKNAVKNTQTHTQRCWSPREIRKNHKKSKFGCLKKKTRDEEKAHTR